MELREIPVEYCDESAVWSLFSSNLLKRLPLREVRYHDLDGATVTVTEVPVHFSEQFSRSYAEFDSTLHLKPYLAIYILHCTELETYRSVCRPRLKAWIESMDAGKQEWMVLYVPALTMLSDSQNKTYIKIYEKLKDELGAITGVRRERCVRFFSCTKKRYVSIDQLSANSDEFWKDAIHAIGDFLGQSIESRIATLKEKALLYEEQMRRGLNSFFPYCLVSEGLAFLYIVLSQLSQAFKSYEEILRFMETGSSFARENQPRDLQMTMEQGLLRYQERLVKGSITDLEFLEYIMAREKMLLVALNNMTLYLSQKFLQFLFKGLKILKDREASTSEKATWLTTMAIYSISSIKQEEYSKANSELKGPYEQGQLLYVLGILYSIVQCQVIRSGEVVQWEEIVVSASQPSAKFLPTLETVSVKLFASGREKVSIDPVVFNSGDTTPSQSQLDDTSTSLDVGKEDYIEEITKSIVHSFQNCGYHGKALFYQAQLAALWKKFGQVEEAVAVLRAIIPGVKQWKEMQLSLELQLLDCLLRLKKPREAFEVAVNICSKGAEVVRPEIADPLCAWIFDLVHNPYLREELVLADSKMLDLDVTLQHSKYMVGERAAISVRILSRLPTSRLHIDRIQVSLLGADSHNPVADKVIIFAINDIDVGSKPVTLTLESKAEIAGVFRFRRAVCHIGRLKLTTELEDKGKVVFEADRKDVALQAKIPSLLVFDHPQSFMIEVQNMRGVLSDAKLSWLPMKSLRPETIVQCTVYRNDRVETFQLTNDRNILSLPVLEPESTCTLLFHVSLEEEDEEPEGEDSDLTVHSPDQPSFLEQSAEVLASPSRGGRYAAASLPGKSSHDTFKTALNYTDQQGTVAVIPETVNLLFLDPLSISGRLVTAGKHTLLSVRLESRCDISLQVFQWNLFGCQSIDLNEAPVVLRPGQETHLAFQISDLEPSITIECRYKAIYRSPSATRPVYEFIERVRQQVFYKRGKVPVPSSNATALKVQQISPRRLSLFSDEEVNLGDDDFDVKEANVVT